MAYVSQPVIAADGNGYVHTVTLFQSIGDRKHIRSDTCPDVERMTGYSRDGQPKNRSIDNIVDIDEISGFLSVLEILIPFPFLMRVEKMESMPV